MQIVYNNMVSFEPRKLKHKDVIEITGSLIRGTLK